MEDAISHKKCWLEFCVYIIKNIFIEHFVEISGYNSEVILATPNVYDGAAESAGIRKKLIIIIIINALMIQNFLIWTH